MKYGTRPFALSPNLARSALSPFSIAVTVMAIVPFLSVPYLNGTTARSPTFSSEPGLVTSAEPAAALGAEDAVAEDGLTALVAAVIGGVEVDDTAVPEVSLAQDDNSRTAATSRGT